MVRIFGWIGVLVGAGVLVTSGWALARLRAQPDPPGGYRPRLRWTDVWLLAAWLLLLAGSAGLLLGAGWAVLALRLWVGMIGFWSLLYLGSNLYAVHGMDEYMPGALRSAVIASLVVLGGVAALATLVFRGLPSPP